MTAVSWSIFLLVPRQVNSWFESCANNRPHFRAARLSSIAVPFSRSAVSTESMPSGINPLLSPAKHDYGTGCTAAEQLIGK